jgi:hypothetical protein
VDAAGTCWTGACVEAERCSKVTTCDNCVGASQFCHPYGGMSSSGFSCIEAPSSCLPNPSCSCLAKDACGKSANLSCQDPTGSQGVTSFSCSSPDAGTGGP